MNKDIIKENELLAFNSQRFFDYTSEVASSCELQLFTGDNTEEACISYPTNDEKYLNHIDYDKASPETGVDFIILKIKNIPAKSQRFCAKEQYLYEIHMIYLIETERP